VRVIDALVPLLVEKTVLSGETGLERYVDSFMLGRHGVLFLLYAVEGLDVADVGVRFSFTAFVLLRDLYFTFCFAMTISNFYDAICFILLISLASISNISCSSP